MDEALAQADVAIRLLDTLVVEQQQQAQVRKLLDRHRQNNQAATLALRRLKQASVRGSSPLRRIGMGGGESFNASSINNSRSNHMQQIGASTGSSFGEHMRNCSDNNTTTSNTNANGTSSRSSFELADVPSSFATGRVSDINFAMREDETEEDKLRGSLRSQDSGVSVGPSDSHHSNHRHRLNLSELSPARMSINNSDIIADRTLCNNMVTRTTTGSVYGESCYRARLSLSAPQMMLSDIPRQQQQQQQQKQHQQQRQPNRGRSQLRRAHPQVENDNVVEENGDDTGALKGIAAVGKTSINNRLNATKETHKATATLSLNRSNNNGRSRNRNMHVVRHPALRRALGGPSHERRRPDGDQHQQQTQQQQQQQEQRSMSTERRHVVEVPADTKKSSSRPRYDQPQQTFLVRIRQRQQQQQPDMAAVSSSNGNSNYSPGSGADYYATTIANTRGSTTTDMKNIRDDSASPPPPPSPPPPHVSNNDGRQQHEQKGGQISDAQETLLLHNNIIWRTQQRRKQQQMAEEARINETAKHTATNPPGSDWATKLANARNTTLASSKTVNNRGRGTSAAAAAAAVAGERRKVTGQKTNQPGWVRSRLC